MVIEARLATIPFQETHWVGIPLPSWRKDFREHLKFFDLRDEIREFSHCFELIDSECLKWVEHPQLAQSQNDYLFFEVPESKLEVCFQFFEERQDILSLSENDFSHLRQGIPRGIAEWLSARTTKKLGTDIQVINKEAFEKLLQDYRELASMDDGLGLLFGHFGDGHLHFNFLPETNSSYDVMNKKLKDLYRELDQNMYSPFAEHGVGIIKKEFVKKWQRPIHQKVWSEIKKDFDPEYRLFPLALWVRLNERTSL